jgi:hypothetical protein
MTIAILILYVQSAKEERTNELIIGLMRFIEFFQNLITI